MMHEISGKLFDITATDITFEKIFNKPYIPQKYINDIKQANLLIIPDENYSGEKALIFPETTSEFFSYVRENSGPKIKSDIAISDDEFQKLELHSAAITVATIIVQYVVLPIATGLITAFLYDLVKKHRRKEEDTSAEVNIIVEETKTKKSKKVTYKGPVSGVKDALDSISDNLFDD